MNKRNKQKISRKHHYLPRNYLNGFTNEEGGFFVYDKKTDKIFLTSPDNTFFEKDLNTITLPDKKKSDFLESVYADMEGEFWPSLDRLRNSTSKTNIDYWDKLHLLLFLSKLYWRLPHNTNLVETLAKKELFKDDGALDYFKLKSKDNDDNDLERFKDKFRNDPAFHKISKITILFAPFFQKGKYIFNQLKYWRFLYTEDDQNWYIVGDNPIIAMRGNEHDPLKCLSKIIFPISGKMLLIATGEPIKGDVLDRNFILDFNLVIIEQSERFVAFSDESFLRAIVALYENKSQSIKVGSLTENLFIQLSKQGYKNNSFFSMIKKWRRNLIDIIKDNDQKNRN